MSDSDLIEVSVWEPLGSGWAMVGGATYTRLDFAPRHHDVGVWSMTLPDGEQAAKITPGRLVSTLFRDELLTWTVSPITVESSVDGARQVTVGGFDALAMLDWSLAWPVPAAAIGSQSASGRYPTAAGTTAPAETVIRDMVADNFRDRDGYAVTVGNSLGRGAQTVARPAFDNLLDLVLRKAKRGGIGVRLGLETSTSATRADLVLRFYVPRDLTTRVHLSGADGSLTSWALERTAPTATRAIVAGAKGPDATAVPYLRVVTTPQSEADAAAWGGRREVYVEGPETFDNPPLDDAGEDALAEGAATTTLTMAAAEPAGTWAFRDFRVGDQVTAIPVEGVEIVDVLTSIEVVHDGGAPLVTPTFGDPDADVPERQAGQITYALRREVQQMKTRKRGTVT